MNWLSQLIRTVMIIIIITVILELTAPGVHETLSLLSIIQIYTTAAARLQF